MKTRRHNKKGFTIVELVIVIAVIAILAGVLIPTFASVVKKANMSADQQAVRQMNTILAMEGAVKKNDIFEVYDALEANGMTAEDYKPLTKDTYFYWDAELDRVLHVDKDMKVIYPTEYADLDHTQRTWINLAATIATKAPANYKNGDTAVTVSTAQELAYIVEQFNKDKTANELTIDLNNQVIDMKGASMNMANEAEGKVTKDVKLMNGTIKNITTIDAAYEANGGDGNDAMYYAGGLFGSVVGGATVTIQNVVIENVNIKNTHISTAAILVANVGSNVVIENVTIKNSTVIAHRNAGALIGNAKDCSGQITLKGYIKMENVHVKTVGGRSGLLFGLVNGDKPATLNLSGLDADKKIELKNCSYSIYECEQNTGTFEGKQLGLEASTNILWSYAYNTSKAKNELEDKKFFEGAYATAQTAGEQVKYTGFDAYVK